MLWRCIIYRARVFEKFSLTYDMRITLLNTAITQPLHTPSTHDSHANNIMYDLPTFYLTFDFRQCPFPVVWMITRYNQISIPKWFILADIGALDWIITAPTALISVTLNTCILWPLHNAYKHRSKTSGTRPPSLPCSILFFTKFLH